MSAKLFNYLAIPLKNGLILTIDHFKLKNVIKPEKQTIF